MRKIFSVFIFSALVLFSANIAFATISNFVAEDAEFAGDDEILFGLSGEIFAGSAYVGDDSGVYYKGLVIQPCLTLTHNYTGIYASVWGSIAPGQSPTSDNGEGNNAGNEIDFILGWAKDFDKVKIDAFYAYYKLFPLNEWGYGDIHSFNLEVGYELTEKIIPYAKVIYDCVDGEKSQNGFIYRFGINFDLHEHLKVDLSGGGHGSVFGAREEIISSGKVVVSFPWTIGPVTVIPEITFQKRMGYEPENGGLSEDILYAGVRVQF